KGGFLMRRFPLIGILLLWAAPLFANPAAEAAGHGDEGIPFKLVYAGINFLILLAILVYFLRKPAREFFASRSALIRGNLEQSQENKVQAEKKYAEYETRLKNIEAEMQGLANSLKKDGELEKQRLVENARHQAAVFKSTSEKILQQELRKAKEELKKETVNLAADFAEDSLRKNLNAQDQGRLIEQYLNKMEHLR
ncbi:MAG TPA: hypothetical protein DF383_13170, partial [Deltaproteobacteria bacterium]|nr:hypothetical protein [Deltaproteobacteria bacterium]